MLIEIGDTESNENTIKSAHFGGNYLFNRESFNEGVGEAGGFDEVARTLNVKHLRYPGGGIAEKNFSLSDPENNYQDTNLITGETITNTDKHVLTPLSEFLEYAQSIDGQVSIVLPSRQYKEAIIGGNENELLTAKEEIQNFVQNVLNGDFGDTVEAFELGNEYYAAGDMVPFEYGLVADKIAIWVQEAIDTSESGFDPMIAVQSAQRTDADNQEIINSFSPEGLSAIDAVIAHSYQTKPWEGDAIGRKALLVDAWNDAKGGGADLKWIVSEWDVSQKADDGLLQGAGILEMFNQLVRNGADLSHIWPLLENTETELAGNVSLLGPTDLMISGEVFRQMSDSLIDMQAVNMVTDFNIDADADIDALVQVYTSANSDKLVVFVSSLDSEEISIDLDLSSFGGIAIDYDHLWGTQIAALDGQDPLGASSLPKVITLTSIDIEGSMANDGIVSIFLDPYNITRLEFSIGEGVSLEGHDQSTQNDTLFGSQFADELFGYAGNDILKGDKGDDLLTGGSGDNVLHGHSGDDILNGGNDRDRLLGGGGNDTLYGNEGNDVLRGGAGDDFLMGGEGADNFVFRENWGRDVVLDFQDGIDQLIFQKFDFVDHGELFSHASQDGNDVVFEFGANDSLTIYNTSLSEVYDDTFLF